MRSMLQIHHLQSVEIAHFEEISVGEVLVFLRKGPFSHSLPGRLTVTDSTWDPSGIAQRQGSVRFFANFVSQATIWLEACLN